MANPFCNIVCLVYGGGIIVSAGWWIAVGGEGADLVGVGVGPGDWE